MKINIEAIKLNIRNHSYYYGLLGLTILLSSSILIELAKNWLQDDNYSHGFLIIPISIYLIFQQRENMLFPAKTSKEGIILFGAGSLGLILGIAAGEYFSTRLALVMMITGFTWYYVGANNFRKIWFPFFFLLFMIPIPQTIYFAATAPMQVFASKVTIIILNFIGVPATRTGVIINLPEYSLEVAEACSGLRSLTTLLALSSLYAYTRMPGKLIPTLVVLLTFPIAISANIFRIVATAIGAYAIDKSIAEDFLHIFSGSAVFISALIMVLITGSVLKWIKNRS